MDEKKRVLLLIFIMAASSLMVAGVAITMLYHTAFKEEKARLVETAQSQARLIEAVARFDEKYSKDYPEGSEAATLSQIIDAHEHYGGFGKTGEFTLSKKEGDHIVFLLSHRHFDLDRPRPVSLKSELAEPMRMALRGRSGTVVGLDYRGEVVVAAYEPVAELGLGIVAKIDISEIRAPFLKAGAIAGLFTVIVVLAGVSLFIKITNPMIRQLQKAHDKLEEQVELRTAELVKSNLSLKQEIVDRKRAEDALAAERQRLFSVLNELPAFIYLREPDHSIRFANRYFKDRFGPYENKKCYQLVRGITAPCEDCPCFSVFETGQPQDWESSRLRDGRIYQIYDYPFIDVDGAQLILEIGIDITKRKQAESEIRRLSSLLLNAQEDERRRIAFELHDELGQDLNVLKLQIGSIKRKMQKDQSSLKEKCENVLLELNKTIEKVRRISRALSPSILVELGLSAALRWLVNNFANHSSIKTSTDIPDTINVFSPEQQIMIYRIFQEILTNIGKHAHTNQVSVNCKRKTDKVFFRVEDNGIGFDIEQIKARSATEKGLGLAGMDERVKMLDGQFEILSREGEGTRIVFEIPIGISGLTGNDVRQR